MMKECESIIFMTCHFHLNHMGILQMFNQGSQSNQLKCLMEHLLKLGHLQKKLKTRTILAGCTKLNETIATTTKVNTPIEQYGNGYNNMQKMGYKGK